MADLPYTVHNNNEQQIFRAAQKWPRAEFQIPQNPAELANSGKMPSNPEGLPVIVCPSRFEEADMLVSWLAEIAKFPADQIKIAREIPFMEGRETGKSAGKIDLVVATDEGGKLDWYGLEIDAGDRRLPSLLTVLFSRRSAARHRTLGKISVMAM